MLGITENTKFLLLDLRDPEDYSLWRIKESINFPAPNIGRDKTIPELFRFRNQPDKLIVVYMNDERKGVLAA
jgi:centrosomal protein CEP41